MLISFPYSREYDPPAPFVQVTLRAKSEAQILAMIDSGADGTILPAAILYKIGARFLRTHTMYGVIGRSQLIELYHLDIQIGQHWIPSIQAAAMESPEEAIIGRDVLNHLIITLDGIGGVTEIS